MLEQDAQAFENRAGPSVADRASIEIDCRSEVDRGACDQQFGGLFDCGPRQIGTYNPHDLYNSRPEIKRILDYIGADFFNMEQPGLFRPLYDALLTHGDYYLHLADFASYVACQEQVDAAYRDPARWARMCVMNIANTGYFSSDRTILEYARQVWKVDRCLISMPPAAPPHSAPGQE